MSNRFIAKLQGFVELTDNDIEVLASATANPRKVAARSDLIREGDRPGPVFVMLEGWAFRYKVLPSGTRQILAYLMPGDACDLRIGLLTEMDHSIQTIGPSIVAMIEKAAMEEILDHHPAIARAMYIAQLVDEGTMRAWITSMGRRSSRERVAHLMCELYLRATSIGLAEPSGVSFPLSQIMIADSLGMTPVHLNRVLKELRIAGAMTLERGSLRIIDPVRIVQLAGFDENYLHRRVAAGLMKSI